MYGELLLRAIRLCVGLVGLAKPTATFAGVNFVEGGRIYTLAKAFVPPATHGGVGNCAASACELSKTSSSGCCDARGPPSKETIALRRIFKEHDHGVESDGR